jgi:hypothetical protein
MSDLNQICSEVAASVPDGLGCAVIDLESGLLIGVSRQAHALPESLLDTMAATVVDMVRGRTITIVEEMIAEYTGTKQGRLVDGLQLTTDQAYVFMSVLQEKPNYLVALVAGKTATLGSGWAAIRSALPKIMPFCP